MRSPFEVHVTGLGLVSKYLFSPMEKCFWNTTTHDKLIPYLSWFKNLICITKLLLFGVPNTYHTVRLQAGS